MRYDAGGRNALTDGDLRPCGDRKLHASGNHRLLRRSERLVKTSPGLKEA